MDQNRKPRNKPAALWSINLQQRKKGYPMGRRQFLQQMVLGERKSYMQIMKLYHFLTPYTIINSKWMKHLNMRTETIKLLEESTVSNVSDTNHSNVFLDMSSEAREIKPNINY